MPKLHAKLHLVKSQTLSINTSEVDKFGSAGAVLIAYLRAEHKRLEEDFLEKSDEELMQNTGLSKSALGETIHTLMRKLELGVFVKEPGKKEGVAYRLRENLPPIEQLDEEEGEE